ncbi:hypothetical protein BC828DRAFT_149832 [Blastocladiella britannica]|nr:hypothetical protein BC828DRAFT_149832 [Blastocladiella britannica]
MGQTIIGLQESIDDIRSDNAELKQVMSKLKSMYALKSVTSKSAFAKRIARLIEEKRIAEERLWDNFRETDAREQVLRKTLGKCQRELVSVQTQYESLKRALKEEQRSKELLQKALSVQMSENKTAAEISSIRRVETFTRFEFERLLQENKRYSEECLQLRVEVARLQGILQAQVCYFIFFFCASVPWFLTRYDRNGAKQPNKGCDSRRRARPRRQHAKGRHHLEHKFGGTRMHRAKNWRREEHRTRSYPRLHQQGDLFLHPSQSDSPRRRR